jgi:hypothetical protein
VREKAVIGRRDIGAKPWKRPCRAGFAESFGGRWRFDGMEDVAFVCAFAIRRPG